MKIILPVIDDNYEKYSIATGFHNSDYVCIYDNEENSYKWMTTSELSEKPGNLSLELKRKGIFTVISNYMSVMALGLFIESGIKVLKAQSDNLQVNIGLFNTGMLMPFTVESAMGMTSCSGSCSSCDTTCN